MNKIAFYINALNADDILRDVDQGSSGRASGCNSQLARLDISSGSIYTVSRCSNSRNAWEQIIQIYDWNYVIPEEEREFLDPDWNKIKADYPELLNSELKLGCNCPAWVYQGYQYIGTELDYVLEPEHRFPEIRNPDLEGTCCKHLIATLRTFFV